MEKQFLIELIDQSLQNDQKSFGLIIEHYQAMVHSLAFRLLCNEEDAKDLVQETFIKVWINLSGYRPDKKFSTWIYKIATNLCLDKLKSSNRKSGSEYVHELLNDLISEENADKKLLNSELAAVIHTLTGKLTPKQKVVFTLRYLEGLDVTEIVEITGLTQEKIKSNLFLARQAIRLKLEKY